ncbi:MICOS complex subunit MIC26 [Entomortierella parvispora]|uniref:MICOS complex subunit n=1 Tax=Entomortierella parvispora TaxID=205924 RepID=A0A9P3HCA6_9FUNG|nr:MICOS complex subunit MIC26 [Entomortierella parvispora]
MPRIPLSLKVNTVLALGAGLLVSSASTGVVALAEGTERKQKLPIYDEPEPEMVIKEEPTRLDEALRAARKETDRQILGMKYHLQMVTNKVVDIEKEAESNIKSVLVKEEEVMPAALYVVVAGFAGSIFASRRNILIRFLSPLAFSTMAFGYFFPASANRLIAQANQSDLSKYLPQDMQQQIRDFTSTSSASTSSPSVVVSSAISSAESKLSSQAAVAEEKVKKASEEVKQLFEKKNTQESIQEVVETKVQETAQAAKETVEDVKEKVAEIKKTVVEEVQKEMAKAEKKVEESDREARLRKIREEDSRKRV